MLSQLKVLPILMVVLITLTACSNRQAISENEPLKINIEAIKTPEPQMPNKIKLENTKWKNCGNMACVSYEDAKKINGNFIAIGRWMSDSKSVIEYYKVVNSDSRNINTK